MKRFWLTAQVSCYMMGLAVFPGASLFAEPIDPNELLTSLRSFDDTIMNEFSIAANLVEPIPLRKPESERNVFVVKLSHENSVWAYRADLDKEATNPSRFAGISPRAGAIEFGRNKGGFVVSRALWSVWLWEPEVCRARDEHDVQVVGVDDTVTTRNNNQHRVFYEKAVTPFQKPEIYMLALASGRMYSQFLTTIDSVLLKEDGMIQCEATGEYPGAERKPCRWELLIEPNATYIVREAKAYWLKNDKLVATFSNEGLQYSESGSYPVIGTFSFGNDSLKENYWLGDGVWEIAFLSLESKADEQFITATRSVFTSELSEGTVVLDSRTNPSFSFVVGEEGPSAPRRSHRHSLSALPTPRILPK